MACVKLLRHCITWMLLCLALHLRPSLAASIDQIISRSMESPGGYGFMYDETSSQVRVDMDMIFSIQDWNRIISLNDSYHGYYKRQAIRNGAGGREWPGGTIYYEIDRSDFGQTGEQVLHAAMSDWMRYTCVNFVPAYPHTQNKIKFKDGDGCSSHVGMVGGTQKVNLARGCRVKGVVIHELGHVLGFHHEQTRPDRDYHVKIHPENIPDHMEYNFRKYTWAVIQDLGVPYDYISIMHYGRDAFSENSRDTIETLDPYYQDVIGNRDGLSFRDIKSANILYNCRGAASGGGCGLQDHECPGEGFVSKDCTCWCPASGPDAIARPYYVCSPGSGSDSGSYPDNGGSPYPGPGGGGPSYPGNGNQGGSSGCVDRHQHCGMWAARGECSNNPAYMDSFCKVSCRLCGTAPPTCRDAYSSCEYWRQKGFCQVTSAFRVFMAASCRLSCGFCSYPPGGGRGGNETLRPCQRKCRNEHAHCEAWASRGECSATPEFMRRYCRKSCNSCCAWAPNRSASVWGPSSLRSPRGRWMESKRKPTVPECVEMF